MKATCLITVLTLLFTTSFGFAQRIHCPECPFESGEQVYVFGNDVKLRAEPNTDSKVLELLKIGEWVKIIEKTEFSWPYKGFDSPFYKIKYDDMTGYILGNLLSLERNTVDGTNYFFAYSREQGKLFLNIRSMRLGNIYKKKIPLSTPSFAIETQDNRGIANLGGILFIDYQAGHNGDENGGVYLFPFEGALASYELSQFHDHDSFYYSEKFIFPDEKEGIPGKIIFKKEKGYNYLREENKWLQTIEEIWRLSWDFGELTPNFREKIAN